MPSFVPLKDLKITFKPHPVTQDLQVTRNEAAIKQSIINLLLTVPGERVFNNDLGSSLNELLFEPLDFAVAGQIENEIKRVLRIYEPRIDRVNVNVEPQFDVNSFNVHLEYEIKGRDDTAPLQINFLLQRTQ